MIVERASAWMRSRGWEPAGFQIEAWRAFERGASGLVHAPTGTGKTLAVWLPVVMEAGDEPVARPSGKRRPKRDTMEPLRVLWITPLRALANDTAASLRLPVSDLGLNWSLELRTGDVSSHVKQRQKDRLPTALVTTPESLSLLLSYPHAAELFSTLRCVVVDEWHELLGTKRGVQTELALARLRRWCPAMRTWGLSATLADVDLAAKHLLGSTSDRASIVRGPQARQIELDILLPARVERFPWAGHMGVTLVPQVLNRIAAARTTLLFTNTRSQAELWHKALLQADDPRVQRVAIHHGSVDRAIRERVEQMLREGQLQAVVCTSSLDLGVDFPTVDQVMQLGSPKGIGRLMQRAGRSGHQPGGVSRVVCVASHAFELVEFSAARAALEAGRIEQREPVELALDVLVQHVVTMALGGGFVERELYEEVRTAWAYRALRPQQWQWVMDFVRSGGPALTAYPQYARITERQGRWTPTTPAITRMHRLGIGTITSDSSLTIAYLSGRKLGTVEERFVSQLRPGDCFLFAGRLLKLVNVRGMTVHVRRASAKRGQVPRWNGARFPLSTQLADTVLERFEQFDRGETADDAMLAMRPLLSLQQRWSKLPRPGVTLVERVKLRDGWHCFLYFFQGRLVHEGIGALMAQRLTRDAARTVLVNVNDYGVQLSSSREIPVHGEGWKRLLAIEGLLDDLLACVDTTVLAKRQFREVARIAGLILPGYPGQPKAMRQVQASAEMFFDVLSEFDADNMLLGQARREVLDRQLEWRRLEGAMRRLAEQPIDEIEVHRLTPLAFPMWADRLRAEHVSSEQWQQRLLEQIEQLEAQARTTSDADTDG